MRRRQGMEDEEKGKEERTEERRREEGGVGSGSREQRIYYCSINDMKSVFI